MSGCSSDAQKPSKGRMSPGQHIPASCTPRPLPAVLRAATHLRGPCPGCQHQVPCHVLPLQRRQRKQHLQRGHARRQAYMCVPVCKAGGVWRAIGRMKGRWRGAAGGRGGRTKPHSSFGHRRPHTPAPRPSPPSLHTCAPVLLRTPHKACRHLREMPHPPQQPWIVAATARCDETNRKSSSVA